LKYRNFRLAFLFGLTLASSAIAETLSQRPTPSQFEEKIYSQTCEEGAESMSEIYGCLADRRSTSLEQQYQRVWQVLDAWQSDHTVKAFENSQSAWKTAMYNYCDALTQLAWEYPKLCV
jgi:uncharacterized protein YukE